MFANNNKSHHNRRLIKSNLVVYLVSLSVFFIVAAVSAQPPNGSLHGYDGACSADIVIQDASSQTPPMISEIYPVVLRAGYAVQVSLKGAGLANAKVVTHDHYLIVNSTRSTDNQVVFDLMVNESAARGVYELTVITPLGEATFEMILASQPPGLLSSSLAGASGVYSPLTDTTVVSLPETPRKSDDLSVLKDCNNPDVATPLSSVMSSEITVVKGSVITRISPRLLSANSGKTELVVHGVDLRNVDDLSIIPSENLIIDDVNVSIAGDTVTATVTVETGVVLSRRRVMLSSVGKLISPLSATADSIYVGGQSPTIDGVEPAIINPGVVTRLTLSGDNFQQARSVFVLPAGDITFANQPTVNDEGTELTVDIAIAPSATLGSRVIAVATPAGISSTTVSPKNALTIIDSAGLQPAIESASLQSTPIAADKPDDVALVTTTTDKPNEGKEALTLKEELVLEGQGKEYYAPHTGVIKGAAIYSLYPAARSIGSSFTLTLQGVGLKNIDGVKFVPSQGITLGNVIPSVEGGHWMVNVAIAEDAPIITRQVQLVQNGKVVPVAIPGSDRFRVTLRQPFIESVTPKVLLTNDTPQLLTLRGQLLSDLQQLRIDPSDGIRIGKPQVNTMDNTVSVEVTVSDNATKGTRIVVVDTQDGSSDMTLNPANSITVASEVDHMFTAIVSSPLGVIKTSTPTPSLLEHNVQSTLLGVGIQRRNNNKPTITNNKTGISVHSLGVAVGPVATNTTPSVASIDTSVILIINGSQLDNVVDVQLQPNTGLTVGSALVGTRQISLPLTIAADAPHTLRRIVITTANGVIEFSDPAEGLLQIIGSTKTNDVMNQSDNVRTGP